MRLIHTDSWTPDGETEFSIYQTYNGLDCCLTSEILSAMPDASASASYRFVRAMQGPALEMMLRGIRVDSLARSMAITHLEKEIDQLQGLLNELAYSVWGKGLNPGSALQKRQFLYEAMRLPEQLKLNKATGQRVPTTDRDALEKLSHYFHSRPVIATILALQDRRKQVSILRSEVDHDGYMRTSYNVAGTETGRWSASTNAFGTGTNLQNIPDKLRRIFIAEPGRKLAYLDLEQAESRLVGIKCYQLFRASRYIDACESGDLHTTVSRLVWPDKDWTGRPREDREIAEETFYRDFSFRDMAKRGGHGTNYYGQPFTMAKHLKVEKVLVENFQRNYFLAFPEIRHWHSWVAQQIQMEQRLVTLLDRPRDFFGRSNDDTTLREAIAFEPQSVVGELLNLAAWRVWKAGPRLGVRLLAQLHDAILIDYPDEPENEAATLAEVSSLMRTPLVIHDRTFTIGNDAATGWNWGKFDERRNPGGVKKFPLSRPEARDQRKRPAEWGLDRDLPQFH